MDIPLLYEADYSGEVNEVWLVYIDRARVGTAYETQWLSCSRCRKSSGAQLSLEEKRSQAQVVIDNSGAVEATLTQVAQLLEELKDGRR